jgi:hypothetical protein
MRRKNKAAGPDGGQRRLKRDQGGTETTSGDAVIARQHCCAQEEIHASASNGKVLVDRFGHLYSRNALTLWPDKVREAMGLRFVDAGELGEAGHAK